MDNLVNNKYNPLNDHKIDEVIQQIASKMKMASSDVVKKMTEVKKSDGVTATAEDTAKPSTQNGRKNSMCDDSEGEVIKSRFV